MNTIQPPHFFPLMMRRSKDRENDAFVLFRDETLYNEMFLFEYTSVASPFSLNPESPVS